MKNKEIINYQNVTHLISEVNYTRIFFENGQNIILPRTLKRFEEDLITDTNFVRINRGILINKNSIVNFYEYEVMLSCGCNLPISRRRSKLINEHLKKSK